MKKNATYIESIILKTAKILNALNLQYAITGGYAVSIWGRLRAIFDIDVVIVLRKENTEQLLARLQTLSEHVYVDKGAMLEAVKNKGEFNVIDVVSGIKAL